MCNGYSTNQIQPQLTFSSGEVCINAVGGLPSQGGGGELSGETNVIHGQKQDFVSKGGLVPRRFVCVLEVWDWKSVARKLFKNHKEA